MVSLQLVDAATHKWAQIDKPVGPEGAPFWAWDPGRKVYEETIELPIDPATPPGRYDLLMVVYDAATGQALPFEGADGQSSPFVVIDQISVESPAAE